MSDEIYVGTSGINVYLNIHRCNPSTGLWQIWKASTTSWVSFTVGDIANYAMAATETNGNYIVSVSSSIGSGSVPLLFVWRQRAGGSVATSDAVLERYCAVYGTSANCYMPVSGIGNIELVENAAGSVLASGTGSGTQFEENVRLAIWGQNQANTDGIQASYDLMNGNRLDNLIDAIKAKTDLVVAAPTNWGALGINASGHVTRVTTADSVTNGVNIAQIGGVNVTATGGRMEVNVSHWRGTQPNALTSGRVEGFVGAMGTGVIDANAIAANAFTSTKFATGVFPSNFPSLVINASGHISRVTTADALTTNNDKTGYGLSSGERTATAAAVTTAIDQWTPWVYMTFQMSEVHTWTSQLQDGGTVDLLLDAIKAKTDNLPPSPAAVGSAMTLTSGERTAIVAANNASTPPAPYFTNAPAGEGGGGGSIPTTATTILDSRKWRPDPLNSSAAENIVTVREGFSGTLAANMPLNPNADINTLGNVTIIGPVVEGEPTEITATNKRKSADGREYHFDVPTLTVKGTYRVSVAVTTLDSQAIPMNCILKVARQ